MHDLTGFQRDICYIIAGLDDPNGREIQEDLDDYYEQAINPGRLYPNLDSLATMGLIEKAEKNGRSNEYRLTSRGRRDVVARLEWEERVVGEQIEFSP